MNAFFSVTATVATGAPEILLQFYSFSVLDGIAQVQISELPDFSINNQFEKPMPTTNYGFIDLRSETLYYVRVRHISALGVASDWQNGPTNLMTGREIGIHPAAPYRPKNFQAVYTPEFATFSWAAPIAPYFPTGYLIELSDTSDFAKVVMDFHAPVGTSVKNTNIGSARAYFARIRGYNSYGYSSYSSVFSPSVASALSQTFGVMGDFIRDDTGVLVIKNGDVVVGDSTQQHQKDIVFTNKGWNHFAPLLGVGLTNYLNDTEGLIGLKLAIRNELERDGQIVEKVELQKGAIQILAIYD